MKAPLPARLERAGRGRGVWQAQKRLHPAGGGRAAVYGRKRRAAAYREPLMARKARHKLTALKLDNNFKNIV